MGYRLLILDDEPNILSALETCFSLRGYDVVTTTDPNEALDRIAHEKFHAALIDINMPVMNGIDVLKRIKSERPTVQVVMMTAYTTIEKAIVCVEHGASDYLLKPFADVKDVEQIVKLACERVSRWERVASESLRSPRDATVHSL